MQLYGIWTGHVDAAAHAIRIREAKNTSRNETPEVEGQALSRLSRLAAARKRWLETIAQRNHAPLLAGDGSRAQVFERLLLYYRVTGVELSMPLQRVLPDGAIESVDAAQERVIRE